jgi:hypothetical protein
MLNNGSKLTLAILSLGVALAAHAEKSILLLPDAVWDGDSDAAVRVK